ncbi:MAG: hypothetical protein LBD21_10930 [Tannerellaceae bacterium]|jgi:ABC-type Fe3+-hydroxamate transport system substrate-binding protein|nr:hypothetical protein [Tannerellaceae bacterium]
MKALPIITIIILSFIAACSTSRQAAQSASQTSVTGMNNSNASAGPPAIVYKTTADYADNVPVTMNAARTAIVSYPDPTDLGQHSKPTPLRNGYLLDNRGINENVAFLRYTYDEYSRLPHPPTLAELQANIIDKNPLAELIRCGYRHQYPDIVEAMNRLIQSGFTGCERIK